MEDIHFTIWWDTVILNFVGQSFSIWWKTVISQLGRTESFLNCVGLELGPLKIKDLAFACQQSVVNSDQTLFYLLAISKVDSFGVYQIFRPQFGSGIHMQGRGRCSFWIEVQQRKVIGIVKSVNENNVYLVG